MIKKLSKYGNSLALIIDKPILELLHITDKTPLEIQTNGTSIVITPIDNKKRRISKRKKVQKAFDEVMETYADTFRKLADS